MKSTKVSESRTGISVINAYNGPQYMFEGIPSKYRSFFEFDVALIKERHKNSNGKKPSVILHEAYFEMH